MDNSLVAYMVKLEVMAFFSGYPLIYSIALSIAGNLSAKWKFKDSIVSLLPFAYALVGALFLGFQLKKLFPDYSGENINHAIQQSYLLIWGLLSLLFWIPALRKKPIYSLIHSLVFFFLLLRDLFLQLFSPAADISIISNDMKVYAASLVLNLVALTFLVFLSSIYSFYKKR